jgi:Flp pilus assembly protein TadD
LTKSDDIGFVVCGSCGTRIKADRNWCLRCHEPLRAFKKPEIPLPSWVRALGGGTLIFALVAIAAVGVIAYVSFDSGTTTPDSPVQSSASRTAGATSSAVVRSQPRTPAQIEQVTFVDTTRRASVQVGDGELEQARTRFEQALERDPKNADTLNNLGLTLQRLGFVDAAVRRLSEAVNADRRDWTYHFNLAHAFSLQQNWSRAAVEYAASLEIFADNYAAQYDLAVAYHMSGNEPEAVKAYEKAIETAPGDPAAHLSFALTLEASGRQDDAVSEYRKYLQMSPQARDSEAVSERIRSLTHES